MFGKFTLGKAKKAIKSAFKRLGLRGSVEIKDGHAFGSVDDVKVKGEKSEFIMVMVYADGDVMVSVNFASLAKTPQTLEWLQCYNSNSLGWRAFIDESGELEYDLDCFSVNPKEVENVIVDNLDNLVDDDTETYYHKLCKSCTKG